MVVEDVFRTGGHPAYGVRRAPGDDDAVTAVRPRPMSQSEVDTLRLSPIAGAARIARSCLGSRDPYAVLLWLFVTVGTLGSCFTAGALASVIVFG